MLRCKLRVTSYWLSHTFRGSKQNAWMNIGKTTYTTELLKECEIQHSGRNIVLLCIFQSYKFFFFKIS